MAAKPVAAGAEGIDAASAGEGVGEKADPLEDVRAIFTTIGMKTTQCDGMINAHNITGMDDFDYIRVDDTGSFIKVCNDNSREVTTEVDTPTQCKLQGFIYWYH